MLQSSQRPHAPLSHSSMNAFKTGYFSHRSMSDIQATDIYKDSFELLHQHYSLKDEKTTIIAQEIAALQFENTLLNQAIEAYRKSWKIKQITSQELILNATDGRVNLKKSINMEVLDNINAMSDQDFKNNKQKITSYYRELKEEYEITQLNMNDLLLKKTEELLEYSYRDKIQAVKVSSKVLQGILKFKKRHLDDIHMQMICFHHKENIINYIKNIPETPMTGHWRNIMCDKNKIQSKIEILLQTLEEQSNSSVNETENNNPSFSEALEKETKSNTKKHIHKALQTLNHDIETQTENVQPHHPTTHYPKQQ